MEQLTFAFIQAVNAVTISTGILVSEPKRPIAFKYASNSLPHFAFPVFLPSLAIRKSLAVILKPDLNDIFSFSSYFREYAQDLPNGYRMQRQI